MWSDSSPDWPRRAARAARRDCRASPAGPELASASSVLAARWPSLTTLTPPDRGPSNLPPAIEYRFRLGERRLELVEHELEQLGGAEAAKTAIANLRDDFRRIEQGMTDVIRAGRADTLKYVAFTIGPAMLMAGAIVVALLTGNVPGKP